MTELPITQINPPPGFIDLGMGNPDISLFPLDPLKRAAAAYFSSRDPRPLQYGIEQGDAYFRHALANLLTTAYGSTVNPALLFVTNGASSGLNLICTLYTRPGDVVFVEEPTYFLALRIFEDHGLKVVSIPMDEDGLRLDALESKLAEVQPKFIYTVPTFQNPSGRTLSQPRREKLVALAQSHNFLIVADEVYQLLAYTAASPQPLANYAADVEQVISLNSFSKILAPGLRLGWVQAHPTVIKKMSCCGLLDSGGGMNPFTSAIMRYLIEAGDLEHNIAHLQKEYSSRLKIMEAALRQHLPKAKFSIPAGGFFFWLRLPGVDTTELRPSLKACQVDIRPGALFSSYSAMREYMRLSFCCYDAQEIEEGIRRLAACI